MSNLKNNRNPILRKRNLEEALLRIREVKDDLTVPLLTAKEFYKDRPPHNLAN